MAKTCVYIIESPSDKDCLYGNYEGHLLIEALRVFSVHHYYCLSVNKQTFTEAIEMVKSIIQNREFPFLHISAHGNENGIQLTDKTFIKWEELKKILIPINDALSGGLCIGMSSCLGFHACRMAMNLIGKLPFFGLVGPTKEIPFNDIKIAFVTFYYRLLKKRSTGEDAVNAMKIASNNPYFDIILASYAKQLWTENLMRIFKELQAQNK